MSPCIRALLSVTSHLKIRPCMKFKSLSLVEAACKMRGKSGADGGELYLILSTPAAGARGLRGGAGARQWEMFAWRSWRCEKARVMSAVPPPVQRLRAKRSITWIYGCSITGITPLSSFSSPDHSLLPSHLVCLHPFRRDAICALSNNPPTTTSSSILPLPYHFSQLN